MTRSREPTNPAPDLRITASRSFAGWLEQERLALAFAADSAHKVFWIGVSPGRGLSIFERTIEGVTQLAAHGEELWIASAFQIWRFRNALAAGETHDGYDRLYAPRYSTVTGALALSDLTLDHQGKPVFAIPALDTIATTSRNHSFRTLWRSAVPNRGLSGVALVEGEPRFVTATRWDVDGRPQGVLIDLKGTKVVSAGLDRPAAPRWHDGKVLLLETGSGRLVQIDQDRNVHTIAMIPGLPRGMTVHGRFAIISHSELAAGNAEHNALREALAARDSVPRCGITIVDTEARSAPHWLRVEGVVNSLAGVASLPGAQRPMAIGFKGSEIRQTVFVAPAITR